MLQRGPGAREEGSVWLFREARAKMGDQPAH